MPAAGKIGLFQQALPVDDAPSSTRHCLPVALVGERFGLSPKLTAMSNIGRRLINGKVSDTARSKEPFLRQIRCPLRTDCRASGSVKRLNSGGVNQCANLKVASHAVNMSGAILLRADKNNVKMGMWNYNDESFRHTHSGPDHGLNGTRGR
jgi:hypothetical protein